MKKKVATFLTTQELKLKKIIVIEGEKVLIGLNKDNELEINQQLFIQQVALVSWSEYSILIRDLSSFCYRVNMNIGKNQQIPLINYDRVKFKIKEKVMEYTLIITDEPFQSFVPEMSIEKDYEFLEPSLTCVLCNQMFYKPVQLNSCSHSFCGYCITQEVGKQPNKEKICPICRKYVRAITNITKHYLAKNPISETILQRQQLHDSDNMCLNGDVNYEDDEDEEQEYKMVTLLPCKRYDVYNKIQNQYLYTLDIKRLECKSCSGEYKSYRCKQYQRHEKCCKFLLPYRQLNAKENQQIKMFCQLCKVYRCKYYYDHTACAYSRSFSSLLDWVQFEYLDFIPYAIYEQLQKELNGMLIKFIIHDTMFKEVDNDRFYYEASYENQNQMESRELLNYQTPLCQKCFVSVYNQMIIKYVEAKKIQSLSGKPDCHKALDCEKLRIDKDHAYEYNHYCKKNV